jgi:proteasome accessory factor A
MEAGRAWMPDRLLLESPIETLHRWSRDPDLTTTGRTLAGKRVSILEHQEMMLDQVERFVESGECEETVAGAAGLVAYWRETLGFLQRGDHDRAARRVEWLAKRRVLESAMSGSGLDWAAPEIRQLDLCFGDLTPERSVFYSLRAAGAVDELVSPAQVAHYRQHPPDDTRARARTTLVRQLGQDNVVSVDWAEVRVRHGGQVYAVQLPRPDQPVVPHSDLTTELVEETALRYHSLRPYMNF